MNCFPRSSRRQLESDYRICNLDEMPSEDQRTTLIREMPLCLARYYYEIEVVSIKKIQREHNFSSCFLDPEDAHYDRHNLQNPSISFAINGQILTKEWYCVTNFIAETFWCRSNIFLLITITIYNKIMKSSHIHYSIFVIRRCARN